MKVNPAK